MFPWNIVQQTLLLSSIILEILRVVTTDVHQVWSGYVVGNVLLGDFFVVQVYTYTNLDSPV